MDYQVGYEYAVREVFPIWNSIGVIVGTILFVVMKLTFEAQNRL